MLLADGSAFQARTGVRPKMLKNQTYVLMYIHKTVRGDFHVHKSLVHTFKNTQSSHHFGAKY